MSKIKIGITIGDINGIGLEVILKTLMDKRIPNLCNTFIYGSSKIVSYHKNIVGIDFQFHPTKNADRYNEEKINVINCWNENVNITLGRPTELSGKYAYKSLDLASTDLQHQKIDAIVTAPINKEAMKMASFPHPGHTEFLSEKFGKSDELMLMLNDDLRIGVATAHIPITKVATTLNKKLIIEKIKIFHETLKIDFGIERPTIAVLGLNPHASDNGVIGQEEEKMIRPAIVESKKNGIIAMGPYPADGFFGARMQVKFDGVLAMYHDQGLIPFKTLSFNEGVNYTAGLPIVRTSPDHGTAYDIVGKNMADPSSFRKAIFTAIDIVKNRKAYFEARENSLTNRAEKLVQVDEAAADIVEE